MSIQPIDPATPKQRRRRTAPLDPRRSPEALGSGMRPAMPPAEAHGLVVLTSRQAVKDIARWKDGAAPVLDVGELSDQAGAAR